MKPSPALIQPIWRRHARLLRSGAPMRCKPGRDGAIRNGGYEKVIFDTYESAERAADELFKLFGDRMRPYPCKHSRNGHFHLGRENGPT